jgi:hypothetical protein
LQSPPDALAPGTRASLGDKSLYFAADYVVGICRAATTVEFYEDELLDGPLLPRRLSMAIRRALIRYYRYYLFTIRLLLEHYLKLQRTKIAPPRKIIVPKNLDFTDPVYRKKLRLPLAKLGAFVHQYFVSLCWLTTQEYDEYMRRHPLVPMTLR